MAITLEPVRPVTDEELLELSRLNPGYQFERDAKGKLIVTPTGGDSALREARLVRQLDLWAAQESRGIAFSSAALFFLPDGSRLMPDASWLRQERWNALSRGAPRVPAALSGCGFRDSLTKPVVS
jgi:Uma2 family endonuclease